MIVLFPSYAVMKRLEVAIILWENITTNIDPFIQSRLFMMLFSSVHAFAHDMFLVCRSFIIMHILIKGKRLVQ